MIVDVHHHLVYAVDDGAEDFEMSVAMLERAVKEQVTDIVCTSHTMPGRHDLDLNRYFRFYDKLAEHVVKANIPVRLYTGTEILYTAETPRHLHAGRIPTLASTWNVLVEFRPDTPYETLRQGVLDVANAGFGVVLAHAERCMCLREGDQLARLREESMLKAQMNANTVLRARGLLGDRWVKRMLRENVIDLVASDAHNVSSRPCALGQAYTFLQKQFGAEMADRLCCGVPAALIGAAVPSGE